SLKDNDDIRLMLYRSRKKGDSLRFKLFRYGAPITLSDALPMLENMGLKILSEHPYEMHVNDTTTVVIQDFEVQPATHCEFDIDQVKEAFQTSFERIWRGQAENDGFNKLILGAQMEWPRSPCCAACASTCCRPACRSRRRTWKKPSTG